MVEFDFGDGSTFTAVSLVSIVTTTDTEGIVSTKYATDGDYYTTLNIYNDVSSIQKTLHVCSLYYLYEF